MYATEGSNPSLSEKVVKVKFSELMSKLLLVLRSISQATVKFLLYVKSKWPYVKEFLLNVKEDTPRMMEFFREVSGKSWPHIKVFLRFVWGKTLIGIRYIANIRQNWPEVKELLLRARGKADEAVLYLREFRQHWPALREQLKVLWNRIVAMSRFAYQYAINIKQHWPEIHKEISMYKEEIEKPEYNKYFAAAAYIPFIGWLIPLYLKKDDPFCREHGKLGFVSSVFFAAVALSIFFLYLLFIPRDWRVLRFLMVLLIYLVYAAYFPFCARGIYTAFLQKKLEMRSMEKYIHSIEL